MSKPLVVHFLWYYRAAGQFILACGKRDRNNDLLSTQKHQYVTCLRCQTTKRFKDPV